MTTALIVYQPPGFLTFSERMICRGAAQCGFRGICFVETVHLNATIRAFGIPAMLAEKPESYNYSSARHEFWAWYGQPEPWSFLFR